MTGWRPGDAGAHRRFSEDEDAARFFGWTVEEARSQPDTYYAGVVRRFQDEWRAGTRLSLAIRRRDTGRAVGAVELRPDAETVEVSYLVEAESRGHGIAPRALAAMLGWAARDLSARRAVLTCHIDNLASRRVAAKCGFEQTGGDGEELRFERRLT